MLHSRLIRRAAVFAAAIAVSATAAEAASAQGRGGDDRERRDAQTFYATTNQNLLLQFDERRPDRISDVVPLLGLGSATLVGIDYRPATGDLYGVGSNSAVYRINPQTGIAVPENANPDGTPIPFTPALTGMKFGFDFNPTVDKIRVTSNVGENLRLNVDEGTLLMRDGNLNPGTPQVVGSAYTNSSFRPFANRPSTTTLYALDAATSQVFVQNPPNAGTLANGKDVGFRVGQDVGFDIVGEEPNVKGYVANRRNGASGSTLYRLNPVTGRSKLLGRIGSSRRGITVTGLAAVQDQQ
jgi:Domain of unknown function (DUF4394)